MIPIDNYPNYLLSPEGKVIKLKNNKEIRGGLTSGGYLVVELKNEYGKKRFPIHQLVASHYLSVQSKTNWLKHKDGNRQNNNYKNLEFCRFGELRQNKKNKPCKTKSKPRITQAVFLPYYKLIVPDTVKNNLPHFYNSYMRLEIERIVFDFLVKDKTTIEAKVFIDYCDGLTREEIIRKHKLPYRKVNKIIPDMRAFFVEEIKRKEALIKKLEEKKQLIVKK